MCKSLLHKKMNKMVNTFGRLNFFVSKQASKQAVDVYTNDITLVPVSVNITDAGTSVFIFQRDS